MNKIKRDDLEEDEYLKIVTIDSETKYSIDAGKLKSEEMIQCPFDETSYISGPQKDGSVIYQAKGIQIESMDKHQEIKVKEQLIKLQAHYNQIARDIDDIHSKQAVVRTDLK